MKVNMYFLSFSLHHNVTINSDDISI